jgi:guanylate kinase
LQVSHLEKDGREDVSSITGSLILILGPSGSGKGTVFKYLKEKHPDYVFPLSCTTRDPRPGEKDGEVYYFVTKEEFEKRKEAGKFLEWAIVHAQNYYGTLKETILKPLREGKVVIREVDVQGLRSIRELVPKENLSSIFLTVDKWETLRARILSRSEISEEELQRRHDSFVKEIEWAKECDRTIKNKEGELEATLKEVDDSIQEFSQ